MTPKGEPLAASLFPFSIFFVRTVFRSVLPPPPQLRWFGFWCFLPSQPHHHQPTSPPFLSTSSQPCATSGLVAFSHAHHLGRIPSNVLQRGYPPFSPSPDRASWYFQIHSSSSFVESWPPSLVPRSLVCAASLWISFLELQPRQGSGFDSAFPSSSRRSRRRCPRHREPAILSFRRT